MHVHALCETDERLFIIHIIVYNNYTHYERSLTTPFRGQLDGSIFISICCCSQQRSVE